MEAEQKMWHACYGLMIEDARAYALNEKPALGGDYNDLLGAFEQIAEHHLDFDYLCHAVDVDPQWAKDSFFNDIRAEIGEDAFSALMDNYSRGKTMVEHDDPDYSQFMKFLRLRGAHNSAIARRTLWPMWKQMCKTFDSGVDVWRNGG